MLIYRKNKRFPLEQMAKKTMSGFVRDLIRREKELMESEFTISEEIHELRGWLKPSKTTSKQRVHRAPKPG